MSLGVPFKDSGGFRGSKYTGPSSSRTIVQRDKQRIRFKLRDKGNITLEIPGYKYPSIRVSNKNAIGLAHWLLDNCSKFNNE